MHVTFILGTPLLEKKEKHGTQNWEREILEKPKQFCLTSWTEQTISFVVQKMFFEITDSAFWIELEEDWLHCYYWQEDSFPQNIPASELLVIAFLNPHFASHEIEKKNKLEHLDCYQQLVLVSFEEGSSFLVLGNGLINSQATLWGLNSCVLLKTFLKMVSFSFTFFICAVLDGIVGKQLVFKVNKDLSLHNSEFMELLAVISNVEIPMCVHSCDRNTKEISNLRLHNKVTRMCKCFYAEPDDFRDSRKMAPRLTQETFLANG